MKTGLFGVINIGASAFRMAVVEFKNGRPKELEYLIKPLRLGVDTFTQGFISLEHVKQAAEILKGFRNKLKEYKIREYRALCTSGVREARNKDFFVDYIKIHTGINLEILEPSEEVYIKYVSAKEDVRDFDAMEKRGVVFANIASGNVTLCITKGDKVLYSGTLPYGSLRLRQMFRHISHLKRYKAFDQYAENMISTVASTIRPPENIGYLIGGGSSINLMLRLFNPEGEYILKSDLSAFYKKVRSYSKQEIIDELGLREDEAAVLVPTLSTYLHLLRFTGSDKFLFSRVEFPVTLAKFYAGGLKDPHFASRVRATFVYLAEKYSADMGHARKVAKFSRKLFDELLEIHSLDKSDINILEAAALIHGVGGVIDPADLALNSYFIIKSLSIPGWRYKTMLLVACAVYQMNKSVAEKDISQLHDMSVRERLLINKLSCILRIADCLDAAKSDLIADFKVHIKHNVIHMEAFAVREPFVELMSFEKYKDMFEETFGIPIELSVKVTYE